MGNQAFTPTFPAGVDPPVALVTGYTIDANDRRRLDTQILALERFLLGITNGSYAGLFNSGTATLSLPTALAAQRCAFDTVAPVMQGALVSTGASSSINVTQAGPLHVTGRVSLHTGSTATQVVLVVYRNGVAVPGSGVSVNTGTASAFVTVPIDALILGAAGDAITLYAFASGTSITLTYAGSITVTTPSGRMGTQGTAGLNGSPGSGVGTLYTIAFADSPFTLPVGSADVECDTTNGPITVILNDGTVNRDIVTCRIAKGANAVTMQSGTSNAADIYLQANAGLAYNTIQIPGVISNYQTLTRSVTQSWWNG